MEKTQKWYTQPFVEEVIYFCALFALIMLPELMKSISQADFIKTLLFFSIVYGQAIFHRYFLFSLFLNKKYLLYGIAAVIFTLLGAGILLAADYWWIDPIYYQMDEDTLLDHYVSHLVLCIISTAAILSILLVRTYSQEVQKRNEAQLMLSEIQIKYLHAQLNPHFFFNMFNNLYGVSLTDPTRTPDLILQLSNLMRYQLENSKKDTVTLEEELAFISNYIALEKERVGQRCVISYTIEDPDALAPRYVIAPLLLITLVENAFKHSLTIQHPWFVSLTVTLEKQVIHLKIANSLGDQQLQNNSTGIGLTNIRQRLELLYPNRFTLETTQNQDTYTTYLIIHLNEHTYA